MAGERWRSAAQPALRFRVGAGVNCGMVGAGTMSATSSMTLSFVAMIASEWEKEARQLSHLGGCRTEVSNVCNGWKADIAVSATFEHRSAMVPSGSNNCFHSLLKGAAFVVALTVTVPARAQDAPLGTEVWKSSCDAHGCSLTGDVSHGEESIPRHMSIVVELLRGGKVESVTFHLPPDADKGELFAVGFADTMKDTSGKWTVKLVPGATRILNIQDCSATCVVTLPNGIVPALKNDPPFDVGQAMTAHNLMLMFYFSHGERIRASAALFRFKDAYESAMRRLP
jgi:hypothetical protein